MWSVLSEVITSTRPLGLIGAVISSVVFLVTMYLYFSKKGGAPMYMFALVISGAIGAILFATIIFRPSVHWVNVFQRADWGGNDADCSTTLLPDKDQCNDALVGRVAVCWVERNEGWPPGEKFNKCRNHGTWCTYKNENISVGTAASGKAPLGRIYICGRSLE